MYVRERKRGVELRHLQFYISPSTPPQGEKHKAHLAALFSIFTGEGLFRHLLSLEVGCESDFNVILRYQSPATLCLQLLIQNAPRAFLTRALRVFVKPEKRTGTAFPRAKGSARLLTGNAFRESELLMENMEVVRHATQTLLQPFDIPELFCRLAYVAADVLKTSNIQLVRGSLLSLLFLSPPPLSAIHLSASLPPRKLLSSPFLSLSLSLPTIHFTLSLTPSLSLPLRATSSPTAGQSLTSSSSTSSRPRSSTQLGTASFVSRSRSFPSSSPSESSF